MLRGIRPSCAIARTGRPRLSGRTTHATSFQHRIIRGVPWSVWNEFKAKLYFPIECHGRRVGPSKYTPITDAHKTGRKKLIRAKNDYRRPKPPQVPSEIRAIEESAHSDPLVDAQGALTSKHLQAFLVQPPCTGTRSNLRALAARPRCLFSRPTDHEPFFGMANRSRPLTDSAMFPGKRSTVIPVVYGSVE